jgi:hypothetical protein
MWFNNQRKLQRERLRKNGVDSRGRALGAAELKVAGVQVAPTGAYTGKEAPPDLQPDPQPVQTHHYPLYRDQAAWPGPKHPYSGSYHPQRSVAPQDSAYSAEGLRDASSAPSHARTSSHLPGHGSVATRTDGAPRALGESVPMRSQVPAHPGSAVAAQFMYSPPRPQLGYGATDPRAGGAIHQLRPPMS